MTRNPMHATRRTVVDLLLVTWHDGLTVGNCPTRGEADMAYTAPKKIKDHPAVESCECGRSSGLDYKHDVFLREGWVFAAGRMEGCRSGHFNSVAEFEFAEPMFEASEPMNAAVNPGFCCSLCGAGFDFGCRCPDW